MNAGQNLKEYGLSVILDSGREPTSVSLEMSASVESKKEEFQPPMVVERLKLILCHK